MRSLRGGLIALATVLVTGAGVWADEPGVVPWAEWDRIYQRTIGSDETTLSKIATLRDASKGKLVEARGKILDVTPITGDKERVGWFLIRTIGAFGGHPKRDFEIPPADIPTVRKWKRWDRVTWRYAVDVRTLEDIGIDVQYTGAADLHWESNPGLEYPTVTPNPKNLGTFQRWLSRYATDAERGKWSGAWSEYRRGTRTAYSIPGEVLRVRAGNEALVRLGGLLYARSKRARRGWGAAGSEVWTPVGDPQLYEELEDGTEVVLLLRLHGFETLADVKRYDGQFQMDWSVWKLR